MTKNETTIKVEHNAPLIFGKESDQCIVFEGLTPKIKNLSDVSKENILIHDQENEMISSFLASLTSPLPLGIIKSIETPSYDALASTQMSDLTTKLGKKNLEQILYEGETWNVE